LVREIEVGGLNLRSAFIWNWRLPERHGFTGGERACGRVLAKARHLFRILCSVFYHQTDSFIQADFLPPAFARSTKIVTGL
jgi:hypothetical protein